MLARKEEQILNGLLLSDLYLEKTPKYARASFDVEHPEFADSIVRNLNGFSWSQVKLSRETWRARTKESPVLYEVWQKWYKDGVKIVPDIKLTPLVCYWWYIGDGSVADYSLKLATYAYTIEEVEGLQEKLHILGIETTLRETNVIFIRSKSVLDFLAFIGPPKHKCYEYKWKARVEKKNGIWIGGDKNL
jgi:hypothetical protein